VLPEWLWDQVQPRRARRRRSGGARGRAAGGARGDPADLARRRDRAAARDPRAGRLRTRATDTWQWRLLNKRPGAPPATAFALKADLAANFAGRGNAYVRKLKPPREPGRPRVIELMSLNAGKVKPRARATGDVVFDDSTGGSGPVTRGTDEIIQIRSFSLGDGLEGSRRSPPRGCSSPPA
jgi:phage portal protein BeeE